MGYTLIIPSALARDRMCSVTARVSFTGLVFGMTATEVNPPAAADWHPDVMVSLYSNPGSLKCTCISINPGLTTQPLASIIDGFSPVSKLMFPGDSRALILPFWIKRSFGSSKPLAGSITLPFLITIVIFAS